MDTAVYILEWQFFVKTKYFSEYCDEINMTILLNIGSPKSIDRHCGEGIFQHVLSQNDSDNRKLYLVWQYFWFVQNILKKIMKIEFMPTYFNVSEG